MTDKEVRAIAIKEVTYADMIAIGATEEIATAASWKARCAFEASWDCAVEKASNVILSIIRDIYGYDGNDPMPYEIQEKLRKIMEE